MNILLVDDSEQGRALLQRILRKEAHHTLTASDGVEALGLLRTEPVDAIVADIMMPRLDGYRLCQAVRRDERLKHIPFIIYTANYESEADEKLAFDVGADAFLRKPALPQTILETLHRVTSQPRTPQPLTRAIPEPEVLQEYSDRLVAKLEQRNAELAQLNRTLRESEERFQNLFESSPDAIIVATSKGIIQAINRQTEQMFGYQRTELIGQAIENLMPARLRPGHAALRQSYIQDPRARPMGEARDLFARRKDGSEFAVDISLSSMKTAEGLLVISTVRDVTKRKQAEEQVRQAEAKYRAIFDHAVEGIIQTTLDGHLLIANPTMARLLGYDTAAELLGAGLVMDRDVYANPDDHTAMLRTLNQAGQRVGFQCQFKRRDGRLIWVCVRARVQRDAQGAPLFYEATCEDITERRQLDDQLREAQKMEAIGQLAGGIAHDFNNILGAILGNVELARMSAPNHMGLAENLTAIHTASQRAADLVKQILTFSRRQEQARQPLELRIIVREALNLLRATLPAAIEFRVELTSTATVLANPSAIHQVIMNLCTNAWHAMRQRPGVLTVTLSDTAVDADLVRTHPDLRPGHYVCLAVADTGCGMDSATRARIFEPFFTTKDVGEGTGLGLAVVHGIVKRHDAAIRVESEPGVGSTFRLYFPVFAVPLPTGTPAPAVPAGGAGEHILFVDDEEPLTKLGTAFLKQAGYRVTSFISAPAALAAFQAQPTAFDLVVTDLNMPGMSGTELAEKLSGIRPDLPILLATGFSASVTPEIAREHGCREILAKPYGIRQLSEAVHRVLQKNPSPL